MAEYGKLLPGLEALGIPSERIRTLLPKLDTYIRELIFFNRAYNLTNTSDYDELAVRHILDSLAAYAHIAALAAQVNPATPAAIGDIGSGGGLPGIPLAAALPDIRFTLVERMDKRAAFLENEAALLGLSNVTVLKAEAEKVEAESFDIAVFRAFRPLDQKMTKTLLRLIKTNGFLAAYKAKRENIRAEMAGAHIDEYKIIPLHVPFLAERERNLAVFQKPEAERRPCMAGSAS